MEVTSDDSAIGVKERFSSVFECMPSGVLFEIFKLLDWKSLSNLSQTCTTFRDLCSQASLWQQLRCLDFRYLPVPLADKILNILKKTPKAETLYLGGVITNTGQETSPDEQTNVIGADRFIVDVLSLCQHIKSLHLNEAVAAEVSELTDRSMEAIAAKCTELESFSIHCNNFISRQALTDLVSCVTSLRKLQILGCPKLSFPSIRHTDSSKTLSITEISLTRIQLLMENVQSLLVGCPSLTCLNLKEVTRLNSFTTGVLAGTISGLDSLKTLVLKLNPDLTQVDIPYAPNLECLHICQCMSLTQVILHCPKLSSLKPVGNANLQRLRLHVCELEELCLTQQKHLSAFSVSSHCLQNLNLSSCSRLSLSQMLSLRLENVRTLDVSGCNIFFYDLTTSLFPQLPSLERLVYGGKCGSSVPLNSHTLQALVFKDCACTDSLSLNMPKLRELTLSRCRYLEEQKIIDGLLHGSQVDCVALQIKQARGQAVWIEPPFSKGSGTPNLTILKLHSLPDIHGNKLSTCLQKFSHLQNIELLDCSALVSLRVKGCKQLVVLKLESCTRLASLHVEDVPCLKQMIVRWCSMVSELNIFSNTVETVSLTGSNFSHATLHCDSLKTLEVQGFLTHTGGTFSLSSDSMEKLSIKKCDGLTEDKLQDLLKNLPNLKHLDLIGSLSLQYLEIPSRLVKCLLTGHRRLKQITIQEPVNIEHLMLNNLPKFNPSDRQLLLQKCKKSLKVLSLRAIPRETTLKLEIPHLTSLCVDQGIHLKDLEIRCPQLEHLRLQGCPNLYSLILDITRLSQLKVYSNTEEKLSGVPLLSLKQLSLHVSETARIAEILSYYCPNIVALTLYECHLSTDWLLMVVGRMSKMMKVCLVSCVVTDLPPLVDNTEVVIQGVMFIRQGQTLTVTVPE